MAQAHLADTRPGAVSATWLKDLGRPVCVLAPWRRVWRAILSPGGFPVAPTTARPGTPHSASVGVNLDDARLALLAERDENTCREPLPWDELTAIGEKLEALEKPKAKERQKAGGGKPGSGKLPEPVPQVRDKVASALGVSGKTYEKAK